MFADCNHQDALVEPVAQPPPGPVRLPSSERPGVGQVEHQLDPRVRGVHALPPGPGDRENATPILLTGSSRTPAGHHQRTGHRPRLTPRAQPSMVSCSTWRLPWRFGAQSSRSLGDGSSAPRRGAHLRRLRRGPSAASRCRQLTGRRRRPARGTGCLAGRARDGRPFDPGDLTISTVPDCCAGLGDLHAGIDQAVFDIAALLEWADRDEAQGAQSPPDGEPGEGM